MNNKKYKFDYSKSNLDPTKKYSAKELLDAGLIIVKRGKTGKIIDFMVEPEVWDLCKGSAATLRKNIIKWKSEAPNNKLGFGIGIWKICPTTKTYWHIDAFRHAKHGDEFIIGPTLEGAGITRINNRSFKKISNMEVVRLLFTGSRTGILICPKTGLEFKSELWVDPRTGLEEWHDTFDLHHWLTWSGQSVHKMSKRLSPSGILQDYDLSEERHQVKLIEIMSCLILNATPHTICHKMTDFSDLEFWLANGITLPWFIQCKENFDIICKEFKLDLDYEYFMYVQSLNWVNDNLDKIRSDTDNEKLKELDHTNPEDRKEFMDRFKKPITNHFSLITGTSMLYHGTDNKKIDFLE